MTHFAKRVWLGLGCSLMLHALGLVALRGLTVLPDVGLDFTLPDEVEFGVLNGKTEAVIASPPEARPAPAPEHAAQEPASPAKKPPPHLPASTPAIKPAPAAGALASFAPKGAQIALRLDLDRVRGTALSQDVGALLAALPDVRLLLEGSGVNPMRDLSRLFLASPDLRRSHVVMAGRYLGSEAVPRAAVDSLAHARGGTATWRQLHGIAIAPWQNADATPRVLALVGPQLFAITREEDLGRVLAVARSLHKRKPDPSLADADAAQALVSMADRELVGVSIENARSFVRGAHAEDAPDRLEVSVRETESDNVEVESHAEFADAAQAEAAQHFWNHVRDQYASHPLVALIGLDGVLRGVQLDVHGANLDMHASVPISRARLLLGFARDALSRPVPELSPARHDATTPE